MNLAIKILRWVLAAPLLLLATVLLFVTIIIFSLSFVVRSPDAVKSILRDSGIYEQGSDIALSVYFEKVKESAGESGREISTADILGNRVAEEDLRQGLREIFPAEWLQTEAENLIDEFYGYLLGKQDNFFYALKLDSRMAKAGDVFSEYLKNKLASLPVCKNVPKGFDLFTATCRPASINLADAGQQIDQLGQNITKVNLDQELTLTPEVKSHIEPMRRMFDFLPRAILLSAGLCFLILLFAFFLIPGRKTRWQTLAIIFWILGFLVLLLALGLAGNVPGKILQSQIEMRAPAADIATLAPIMNPALGAIQNTLALRAGFLALIALGLGGAAFIRARKMIS